MILHQDFKELLELLDKNQVEYLIVGAFALGFYGNPRTTGDIDIWINISKENARQMVKTFEEFGISSLGYSEKDFMDKDVVVQIGVVPVRIDILTGISGVEFNEAYKNREEKTINEVTLKYLSREDFIKNKLASGRKKDLADIETILTTRDKK
ncbi:MAG: hypothetical protein CO129_06600 [Ignavibacteriales bacterium CG_4_9_14_3_um_filter_34_10]|nr:MAG: hypothetical protein CO129_06600 [Ignavibacteriales bacterium CG_4_9_14_3_um_filter_34_10]